MHVFVESNFILELAFQQQDHLACERILRGAVAGHYTLHVPTYVLAEVFEVMRRRRDERDGHQRYLQQEVIQHRREASAEAADLDQLDSGLAKLLLARTQTQTTRVFSLVAALAADAPGPALTAAVVREADAARGPYKLAAQDALVWASVLAGLRELPPAEPKLFITRNKQDFDTPPVVAALRALGCAIVTSFQSAATRLQQ